MEQVASDFDDAQLEAIRDYLRRSVEILEEETRRLRSEARSSNRKRPSV